MKWLSELYLKPSSTRSLEARAWSYRQSLVHAINLGGVAVGLNLTVITLIYLSGLTEVQPLGKVDPWPFRNAHLAITLGFLDLVVFGPVIETAFMFVPVWILIRLRTSVDLVPFVSGAVWAIIHTKGQSWLPLLAFFPFYLFTVQLLQENRISQNRAWMVVSASHGFYNFALVCFQYLVFGPLTGTDSLF